ncbi:reverse transcriptase, partial [Zunongwangia sp. F363]|nr:reverse transcriptase [Zunongwangia sp. F363]
MKKILELSDIEARKYLLKEESYFNFDLPKYFTFQALINKVSEKIENKNLSDFYSKRQNNLGEIKTNYPSDFEEVNYIYLNNKDGKFSWRPYQLIHPALYVSLVHKITEKNNWDFIKKRFEEFSKDSKINCSSIPLKSEDELSDKATNVGNWWRSIEQK